MYGMKFLASHWFETIMDQSLFHYLPGEGGEEGFVGDHLVFR